MEAWGVAEVQGWVGALGGTAARYAGVFAAQMIDGSVLGELSERDLREELGVAELGVRRLILREVERCKRGGGDAHHPVHHSLPAAGGHTPRARTPPPAAPFVLAPDKVHEVFLSHDPAPPHTHRQASASRADTVPCGVAPTAGVGFHANVDGRPDRYASASAATQPPPPQEVAAAVGVSAGPPPSPGRHQHQRQPHTPGPHAYAGPVRAANPVHQSPTKRSTIRGDPSAAAGATDDALRSPRPTPRGPVGVPRLSLSQPRAAPPPRASSRSRRGSLTRETSIEEEAGRWQTERGASLGGTRATPQPGNSGDAARPAYNSLLHTAGGLFGAAAGVPPPSLAELVDGLTPRGGDGEDDVRTAAGTSPRRPRISLQQLGQARVSRAGAGGRDSTADTGTPRLAQEAARWKRTLLQPQGVVGGVRTGPQTRFAPLPTLGQGQGQQAPPPVIVAGAPHNPPPSHAAEDAPAQDGGNAPAASATDASPDYRTALRGSCGPVRRLQVHPTPAPVQAHARAAPVGGVQIAADTSHAPLPVRGVAGGASDASDVHGRAEEADGEASADAAGAPPAAPIRRLPEPAVREDAAAATAPAASARGARAGDGTWCAGGAGAAVADARDRPVWRSQAAHAGGHAQRDDCDTGSVSSQFMVPAAVAVRTPAVHMHGASAPAERPSEPAAGRAPSGGGHAPHTGRGAVSDAAAPAQVHVAGNGGIDHAALVAAQRDACGGGGRARYTPQDDGPEVDGDAEARVSGAPHAVPQHEHVWDPHVDSVSTPPGDAYGDTDIAADNAHPTVGVDLDFDPATPATQPPPPRTAIAGGSPSSTAAVEAAATGTVASINANVFSPHSPGALVYSTCSQSRSSHTSHTRPSAVSLDSASEDAGAGGLYSHVSGVGVHTTPALQRHASGVSTTSGVSIGGARGVGDVDAAGRGQLQSVASRSSAGAHAEHPSAPQSTEWSAPAEAQPAPVVATNTHLRYRLPSSPSASLHSAASSAPRSGGLSSHPHLLQHPPHPAATAAARDPSAVAGTGCGARHTATATPLEEPDEYLSTSCAAGPALGTCAPPASSASLTSQRSREDPVAPSGAGDELHSHPSRSDVAPSVSQRQTPLAPPLAAPEGGFVNPAAAALFARRQSLQSQRSGSVVSVDDERSQRVSHSSVYLSRQLSQRLSEHQATDAAATAVRKVSLDIDEVAASVDSTPTPAPAPERRTSDPQAAARGVAAASQEGAASNSGAPVRARSAGAGRGRGKSLAAAKRGAEEAQAKRVPRKASGGGGGRGVPLPAERAREGGGEKPASYASMAAAKRRRASMASSAATSSASERAGGGGDTTSQAAASNSPTPPTAVQGGTAPPAFVGTRRGVPADLLARRASDGSHGSGGPRAGGGLKRVGSAPSSGRAGSAVAGAARVPLRRSSGRAEEPQYARAASSAESSGAESHGHIPGDRVEQEQMARPAPSSGTADSPRDPSGTMPGLPAGGAGHAGAGTRSTPHSCSDGGGYVVEGHVALPCESASESYASGHGRSLAGGGMAVMEAQPQTTSRVDMLLQSEGDIGAQGVGRGTVVYESARAQRTRDLQAHNSAGVDPHTAAALWAAEREHMSYEASVEHQRARVDVDGMTVAREPEPVRYQTDPGPDQGPSLAQQLSCGTGATGAALMSAATPDDDTRGVPEDMGVDADVDIDIPLSSMLDAAAIEERGGRVSPARHGLSRVSSKMSTHQQPPRNSAEVARAGECVRTGGASVWQNMCEANHPHQAFFRAGGGAMSSRTSLLSSQGLDGGDADVSPSANDGTDVRRHGGDASPAEPPYPATAPAPQPGAPQAAAGATPLDHSLVLVEGGVVYGEDVPADGSGASAAAERPRVRAAVQKFKVNAPPRADAAADVAPSASRGPSLEKERLAHGVYSLPAEGGGESDDEAGFLHSVLDASLPDADADADGMPLTAHTMSYMLSPDTAGETTAALPTPDAAAGVSAGTAARPTPAAEDTTPLPISRHLLGESVCSSVTDVSIGDHRHPHYRPCRPTAHVLSPTTTRSPAHG